MACWGHIAVEEMNFCIAATAVCVLMAGSELADGWGLVKSMLSVCLSVYHKLVFYRNGWTDRASFGAPRLPSTYSSRYSNEIQVSTKIRTGISRLELCLKLRT